MAVDSQLILGLAIGVCIVLVLLLMKYLKQPYAVAYIISGILLGTSGLGLITNTSLVSQLGNIGIVLLLFFVGMEISLPKILSNWKIAILGTIGQIILTALFSIFIGKYFGWSIERSILTSFVMVLSSTAVIVKILEDHNEMNTKVGQNALAITIIHDLAVIPMILILTFFTPVETGTSALYLPIIGGILFTIIILFILKSSIKLPFSKVLQEDHELQVFVAILFCLIFAIISEATGLSTAFGAFIAGLVLSSSNETGWVKNALHPFKIFFLALFFVYIGLLIDIKFILDNYIIILVWVSFIFIINTIINTIVLLLLKNSLKESIHAAAILAQTGEFGFLLVSLGLSNKILQSYDYNLAISVIALTLLLSPLWIVLMKKIMNVDNKYIAKLRRKYKSQTK